MPYIGTSPSNGVRRKHTYTATASQTSFSGAGAEGATLSYTDSNFVDVYQNGVKLSEADYTATSGTAIVLATGATVSDMVEIVVYDVFSVSDTVSKSAGGTFDGNVTMAGTHTVTGVSILNGGIDVAGDITLDVGGADIIFKDDGTQIGRIRNASSGELTFQGDVQDKNMVFNGNDGGSTITALTLDMSADGHATFKNGVTLADGNLTVANGHGIDFSATADGSGMSSELLADYEEGKFTATCANSVTLHSASSSMVYTKIGRQVHVSGSLRINNSNGGSAFTINNLPFTSSSDSAGYYTSTTLRFYSWNLPLDQSGTTNSTVSFLGRIDPNSTTINFMQVRDNAATIVLPAAANAYIIFGITYFAA